MLQIKSKRGNGELLAVCESCKGGTRQPRPTMAVNPKKRIRVKDGTWVEGWVYCFRCGFHRPLTDKEKERLTNRGMVRDDHQPLRTKQDTNKNAPHLLSLVPPPVTRMGQRVLEYIKSRRVEPERVFYSYDLPYYVIFHVENWWQGRAVLPNMNLKNIFPSSVPHNAMYKVQGSPEYTQVVLVEGIFDALACRKKGRLTIALLGSVLKPAQKVTLATLLRGFQGELIIFLDSDADIKSRKMQSQLRDCTFMKPLRVIWGGETGDPDSISTEVRERLISDAVL